MKNYFANNSDFYIYYVNFQMNINAYLFLIKNKFFCLCYIFYYILFLYFLL